MIEAGSPRSRRVARDRKRLTQAQRYGKAHRYARRMLVPFVAAGLARCVRCGGPIEPGEPWDLGHADHNPGVHSGPEHAGCNRSAPHRNGVSRAW